MLLYLLAIGITMVLVGNYFWFPIEYRLVKILLWDLMLPFLMFALDGISTTLICHALPNKCFTRDIKFHHVIKSGYKFYELLEIKFWKDHVLVFGMLTSFSKKKVADPNDLANRTINNWMQLWCSGSFMEFYSGIILMLLFPKDIAILFILPSAIANSILSILHLMILRYKVPRLNRLLFVQEKKANRGREFQNPSAEPSHA